ncbi:hypothetical protein, partial [Escherichia coli]|uniref:hypothetical protein n=2 Tax=Escherichia coli TaxID=562 RepID=UPI0024127725
WSTSKTPSYTKSVSWQHHPKFRLYNENDAKANDKVVVFTTCPYIKWGNIHAPGSVTNATLKHNDSNKTSGDYYA